MLAGIPVLNQNPETRTLSDQLLDVSVVEGLVRARVVLLVGDVGLLTLAQPRRHVRTARVRRSRTVPKTTIKLHAQL